MRLLDEFNGKYGDFFQKQAMEHLEMFNAELVTVTHGVVRWNSNKSIPPTDILELWYYAGCGFDYEKTILERDKEVSAFLENYRKAKYTPSEEEKFEMRAAYGEGVKLMDVITGQEIIL